MANSNRIQMFFLRGIVFLFILIIIDLILGNVLYKLFLKEKTGEYAIANYVVYKAQENILILGSSRASHHYNSKIISDSLGMSCYNGGRDGQGIGYYAAILTLSLEKHIPKVLILDINNRDLDADSEKKDNLACLLPYLKTSSAVKPFIVQKSPFELTKASIQTYRYNGQIFSMIQHTLFSKFSSQDFAGYKPLSQKMDSSQKPKIARLVQVESIDKDNLQSLDTIISLCKKNNISLFVFVSPRYSLDPTTQSVKMIKQICNSRQIQFGDYSKNDTLFNARYFSDASHLNQQGADLYSSKVAAIIKRKVLNATFTN